MSLVGLRKDSENYHTRTCCQDVLTARGGVGTYVLTQKAGSVFNRLFTDSI